MAERAKTPAIRFNGFTDDWEQRKLGDLVVEYSDPVPTPHEGYERLGIRSHGKGTFHNYVKAGHELETAQMHRVAADKLIVNITFAWEHAVAVTDVNDAGKLVSHRFPQFSLSEKLDPKFLQYLILDDNFRHHLWLASPGGAGRNRVLKKHEMLEYKMQIPSVAEQKQIACTLDRLDNLITLHQRKYDKLVNVKKSMLSKMFPRDGSKVPEIRFKGFTDPWEQRKLGEVGKARSGVGFPDTEQGGSSGIPFFKVSDMNNDGNENEMNVANNYVTDAQIAARRWSPIEEVPAIFFAKVGAAVMLNRKRLCRFPFLLDNNTMAYSLSKDQWDADFAKALFETVDLTTLVQVGALPSYNAGDVEAMEIMLPEIPEQRQIGAYFRQLDNLITLHQRKENDLLFQKIRRIIAKKMDFAWELRKLGDITNSYSGGTPTVGNHLYYGGDIPFIRSAEINSESTELFITETGLKNSSAKMVKQGDILYALYGATSGEVGRSRINGAINQAILAIIPCKEYDAEYLAQWLRKSKSSIIETYLQGGQGNLSGAIVKDLEIGIPELAEQLKIGSILYRVDNLITLHQRQLERLKNIKAALLEKMFV